MLLLSRMLGMGFCVGVVILWLFDVTATEAGLVTYNPELPISGEEDIEIRIGTGEPFCSGHVCYSQEDCCPGADCITHTTSDVGVCAKLLAQPEGRLCLVTERGQCAYGLVCTSLHTHYSPLGICVSPNRVMKKKEYFEPCEKTLDCDTKQKLCCRVQPGSPGNPKRKICSYFENPLEECIF